MVNRGRSIAIIDDEPDLVNLFSEALSVNGFKVCTFTDSIEAFDHIKTNPKKYDLVISDYRMPSMNGIELCTRLIDLNPKIRIILMSAFIDFEFKIPQFTCLHKPFTLAVLIKTVNYILSREKNIDIIAKVKRKHKNLYDIELTV